MGPFFISAIVAAGASIWIYYKFQRFSGNNTQQSLIGSTVAGLALFIVLYFILKSIL